MSRKLSTCWVVTDGKAGMESQCVGLAHALGLTPEIKRIRMRQPWRLLSPWLRAGLSLAFDGARVLAPPWPDILIASGRLSVPASLHVRAESRRAGTPTFTVQVQDPVILSEHFDLVVTPLHDRLTGNNVVATLGALHGVTPEKLTAAAANLAPRIAGLNRPLIGVLIGGPNAAYRMGADEISQMAGRLAAVSRRMKASLLVTPSRRTGNDNVALVKSALDEQTSFIWDGSGDNPYFGILGLSDYFVVTADSVNMITEACVTGKPVYVYGLPGGSPKSSRFLSALAAGSHTRPFEGTIEPFATVPLREMDGVVAAIRQRLNL